MKTTRIRAKVKTFLLERPRSTTEIKNHINKTTRHGTTMQQLGNVLSKDKDIMKVGLTRVAAASISSPSRNSSSYEMSVWALKDSYLESLTT